jgi:hypothetical protein
VDAAATEAATPPDRATDRATDRRQAMIIGRTRARRHPDTNGSYGARMAHLPHPLRRFGGAGAITNARRELDARRAQDDVVDALIARLAPASEPARSAPVERPAATPRPTPRQTPKRAA